MPTFAYTARDARGQQVTGTVSAEGEREAIAAVRADGKYPITVRIADGGQRVETEMPAAISRMSRADLIQFSTQLSIMVETGVQLSEALECIARQAAKPAVRAIVSDIADSLQNGSSLSDAMSRHPRSFPQLYIAIIRASEKSGLLGKLMARATEYLRDEQQIIRRVKGALTYPLIMFSFALTTTTFLLAFVLPRFTVLYANKRAALPLPTKILMAASNFLVGHWPAILVGVATAAISAFFFLRTPTGARTWHYVQLNMPLFGSLYRKLHLSRGLRMVGTMTGAGIQLLESVATAHDLCANSYFRRLWHDAGEQIQAGRQFSDALFACALVPPAVAQMIFSAEKSGKLAVVMEQVAAYAEIELKEQITSLTRYIEPIMIVLMGAIIGGVVMALLLPVFSLSKVIAH